MTNPSGDYVAVWSKGYNGVSTYCHRPDGTTKGSGRPMARIPT